jgi:hypothetical protein
MKTHGPLLLVVLVTALTVGAGAVLVCEQRRQGAREVRAREFQRLVGGLGGGPAVDLSRCAFSFDPRLCPHCPQDDGPIPAGAAFCPHHACSILYYPPLDRLGPAQAKSDADVLPP